MEPQITLYHSRTEKKYVISSLQLSDTNTLLEQINSDPFQFNENTDEPCQAAYSRFVGETSLMCYDSPQTPANSEVLSSCWQKDRTVAVTKIWGRNLTDIPHPGQLSCLRSLKLYVSFYSSDNFDVLFGHLQCTLEDEGPRIISDASNQSPEWGSGRLRMSQHQLSIHPSGMIQGKAAMQVKEKLLT